MQFNTLAFDRAATVTRAGQFNLQQGYQQVLTAQQANAPALSTLVTGPGVYAGTDGKTYLVSPARLGYRANLPRTPDIAFTSDGTSWKITAIIQIFRGSGTDPKAVPLLLDGYRVTINPGDSTPGFTFPTVTPFSPPDSSTDVVTILKAEGAIDETLALTLLRDKPNAQIEVIGSLSYRHVYTRIIHPAPAPVPSPVPPHPFQTGRLTPFTLAQANHPVQSEAITRFSAYSAMAHAPVSANGAFLPPRPITETVTDGITADQKLGSIPCHFDPGLMDFKPVYAVIMGTGSDGTVWSQQTGQGYSRPSSGSDAFYILPDSYRLAIDANSGLPAISLLLVETPPAAAGGVSSFSLRVRLAVAPVLDGGRLEKIRESLRASQNILYAQLAIGGYSSASFLLSAMFSQLPGFQSSMLSGDAGAEVDAAGGFELVLDCSLEFYTLITKLLASADGLQGTVQFKIVTAHVDATPPIEDTTLTVDVPVVLSFQGPFPLKLAAQIDSTVPADPASITIALANPLASPLNVLGIYPTLMTTDPGLGITTGATLLSAAANQFSLAPAEQKSVALSLTGGAPLPSFTALTVDFGTCTPAFDSAGVLDHYQSIVAASGLNAAAHFSCYLLQHPDQIPSSMTNLIGMQIEVQHGDGPTLAVPLTRDTPSLDVSIPYTFAEFLAGESLTQPTFKYRAKSLFTDHSGDFGDWITQTGGMVEITPF